MTSLIRLGKAAGCVSYWAQYTSPIRASTATTNCAWSWVIAWLNGPLTDSWAAIASKLQTGRTGRLAAIAKPWTAATPKRTPVKAPGPTPMAIASKSWSVIFASASSSSIQGSNSPLAPADTFWCLSNGVDWPKDKATEHQAVEVSMANNAVNLNP